MKAKMSNAAAVIAAIEHGDFCDVGHYYCPRREGDTYLFPSGGTLALSGAFDGPRRLYEQLAAVPVDYRPEPVPPLERYPRCCPKMGSGCQHGTPYRSCAV